ncbi:MAG: carbohydrate kinase family protein [Treponema sp.]|jgi:sugar/nucleoside kinase (ribokinase family)|nr:carbohydrate kinase family protein [Treponema sp.]
MDGIELLCIGNAMVDIFAGAEGETLKRLGLTEAVQHVTPERMDHILGALGIFAGSAATVSSGGGASNAAKTAALLGIRAAFTGSVGGLREKIDPFGRIFKRDLEEAGVVLRLKLTGKPTGICLYLRTGPEGGVRIAASASAALDLSPGDIPEAAVRDARIIVPDGYLLDRDDLIRHIIDTARRFGKTIALDAGSAVLAGSRAEELAAWCRNSRLILFMNENETAAFCGALNGGGDQEGFLRDLASGGPFPVIVEKRGREGAAVYAGGRICRKPTVPAQPLESAGAGDAFCGAFLAAWLRGKPAEECADLGNRTAGAVLGTAGTKISREIFRKLKMSLRSAEPRGIFSDAQFKTKARSGGNL